LRNSEQVVDFFSISSYFRGLIKSKKSSLIKEILSNTNHYKGVFSCQIATIMLTVLAPIPVVTNMENAVSAFNTICEWNNYPLAASLLTLNALTTVHSGNSLRHIKIKYKTEAREYC
jgi:hypothetical protein